MSHLRITMRQASLTAMLAVFAASVAVAQPTATRDSSVARQSLYRDPLTARQLSFVPGLGHVYAGEYLRGYATWVGTIGGLIMGPTIFQLDNCTFQFLSACERKPTWPYQIGRAHV